MRLRLFLSFFLVVLISVLTVSFIARLGVAREVRQFMFRGSMLAGSELVSRLEDYYRSKGSWNGVDALLAVPGMGNMMGQSGAIAQRLVVADAQGNIVGDSTDVTPSGHLSLLELSRSTALRVNNQTVGYLLAQGGMNLTSTDEQFLMGRLNRAALIAGLAAGGVSLLLAVVLAYQLLRPVRELTLAARHLAQGDLSQRVAVRGDDELSVLGQTFNQMAGSLQRAEEGRRAVTADIAHELRTPLAVQRADLEALQDGIYPLSGENLQPILEQNLLLTRLVDDLSTLALADAGQLTLERVPTDLPALIQRVLERFQHQAAAQGIAITFNAAPLPLLSLDPLRIEQILNNLLSNALRHTPASGKIELFLSERLHSALLQVHDSGPGIPADALPHIFERFYRADRSRSRAEGGSGLGLTIARQLARAHGGDLTASNHPDGGAVFTLSLPLS